MATVPHLCVIRLGNRTVAYNGQSLRLAAVHLKPNTVHGKGKSAIHSENNARQIAAKVAAELKQYAKNPNP